MPFVVRPFLWRAGKNPRPLSISLSLISVWNMECQMKSKFVCLCKAMSSKRKVTHIAEDVKPDKVNKNCTVQADFTSFFLLEYA